jgi:hypothetical protein
MTKSKPTIDQLAIKKIASCICAIGPITLGQASDLLLDNFSQIVDSDESHRIVARLMGQMFVENGRIVEVVI